MSWTEIHRCWEQVHNTSLSFILLSLMFCVHSGPRYNSIHVETCTVSSLLSDSPLPDGVSTTISTSPTTYPCHENNIMLSNNQFSLFGDTIFVFTPSDHCQPPLNYTHIQCISSAAFFLIHTLTVASSSCPVDLSCIDIARLNSQLAEMVQSMEFVGS